MLGMEMMVKNMLGIDPEELRRKVEQVGALAGEKAVEYERRFAQVESMLLIINDKIDRLLHACGEVDPPQPLITKENENAETD